MGHVDEFSYQRGSLNALMTPTVNNGEAVHWLGPIILGMFRDMGWTMMQSLQFAQWAAGAGIQSDVVVQSLATGNSVVRGQVEPNTDVGYDGLRV